MKKVAVISLAFALILIPILGVNCDSDSTDYGEGQENTDTLPPIISGITVSDITGTEATVSWTTDELATGNIEYGPNTGYGNSFPSPSDDTVDKTSHSYILGDLSPGTTYHFMIKSKDSAGNESESGDNNFTTLSVSLPAATLSGQPTGVVNNNTADISVAGKDVVSYKYKLDDGTWSNETPVETHITLSELAEGVHTVSTVGKDADGNWQTEASSTTASWKVDTTAPVISDIVISDITETSVSISWATDELATGNIEYGLDTGYYYSFPYSPDITADNTSHGSTLSDLSPGTTYYFRVKSTDNVSNESESGNYTFTTNTPLDITAPVISGVFVSGVTETTATISWITDELATSQVEYGTTTAYGSASTLDGTPVGTHVVYLGGLSSSTTYHFRVKSRDASGNKAISIDYNFTTSAPIPPVQIIQSLTLEQAHSMYVAGSFDVIIQNESYVEGNLAIAGTDMNLSPWCAACPAKLQSLDRTKTYFLYSGVGASGENSYNSEVMSTDMKNLGFEKVYFLSPATLSDWLAQYPYEVI